MEFLNELLSQKIFINTIIGITFIGVFKLAHFIKNKFSVGFFVAIIIFVLSLGILLSYPFAVIFFLTLGVYTIYKLLKTFIGVF